MTPLRIRLPTREEEQRAIRFQVHKNYVAAIAQFLRREYGSGSTPWMSSLLEEQRRSRSFRRIDRRPVNEDRLTQYLTLAWASEIQFRLSDLGDVSLLHYSNAWAPIHAYYAVYMAAQAWFTTLGAEELVDNHTGSLNTLANQIRQRSIFPLPWAVICSGCPQLGEVSFTGLPPHANSEGPIELLSNPSPADFWPRYCKLLETTRRRRLDRNLDEWKRARSRQRTSKEVKRAVAGKLLPTTLFDFFWRLRVRSNYRDVKSFLMAGVATDWQEEFRDSLLLLTEATMTLLESLVVAYAGAATYDRIVADFLLSQRGDVPVLRDPWERRRELLAD